MHGSRWASSLSRRFVVGDALPAARRKIETLQADGLLASVYYLGEYVVSEPLVEENVRQILQLIEASDGWGASTFLSVDPTQVGYSISDELGAENALRIGRALAERGSLRFLMIDMEDASYVERSIALYARLRSLSIPSAITLQTYLRRTVDDVQRLGRTGAAIRLCKGAFVASRDIAWTRRHEIDAAFLAVARRLLSPEMKAAGAYPILATHDDRMIEALVPELRANGWQPDQYEIEMLYGFGEERQRQLAREGHTVRVYVPYGEQWWPYTVRRIGEKPANARFVLRAILGREPRSRGALAT
jgi:proline dehydrogenase